MKKTITIISAVMSVLVFGLGAYGAMDSAEDLNSSNAKVYNVTFTGPTGKDPVFAEMENANPHSGIVQGADYDKVWDVKVGDAQFEVGFSYRYVNNAAKEKKLLVEALVLSYIEDSLWINTTPLAYFFGNRYPYEGTDLTPDAEMPPVQSNLSYGSPSDVRIKEKDDKFTIKMVFEHGVAQIYSLRGSEEWKPEGYTADVIDYNKLNAEVNITFSKTDPGLVTIRTVRHLAEDIENHNGFNLLTQVVYSDEPISVEYLGTGQVINTEKESKSIKSLQFQAEEIWQLLSTEEFDKNPSILATGSSFDKGWKVTVEDREFSVLVPGFRDFAIMEPYIDVEGTSHIPNNLYTFRYNGWYDYLGRGYNFAVIDEDPIVVKATITETHLGKGWISVTIPRGDYEDKVELDFRNKGF